MARDEFSAFDDQLGADPVAEVPTKKDKPVEPDAVPMADYEKVRLERDEAARLRDEAIRGMLAGAQQAAPPPPPQAAPSEEDFLREYLPDDVDSDVLALLTPVLRAQKAVIEKEVAEQYGPVAEAVQRDENLKVIGERVDGFSDELIPEIRELYKQMPPHEQEEYDNRLGMEILARRVLDSRRGRSDMSGMAHTAEPFNPPSSGNKATEQDVWDMDDKDFEALVQKVKMRGRG